MPFGHDIRLRRVICLRAWVDLFYITFLHLQKYITICECKLYHIGKSDISLNGILLKFLIFLPKALHDTVKRSFLAVLPFFMIYFK